LLSYLCILYELDLCAADKKKHNLQVKNLAYSFERVTDPSHMLTRFSEKRGVTTKMK